MRTFDQGIEAFVREPRAGIFRRAQHDLLVAALDKDGCQFVGQGLAARDGEQLLLLFGPRALDQRSDIELLGLRKNRRRYLDGIVAGKQAQYLWRGDGMGARSLRCRSMTERLSSMLCEMELSSSWMSSRGAPI